MKQFSAAFIAALKDAIVGSVWYREELRRFLTASLADESLLRQYDWQTQQKREIVNDLIDRLAQDQTSHFEDFKRLSRGILEMSRYPGLEKLEDSERRIAEAKRLQADLQRLVTAHNQAADSTNREKEFKFLKEEYERRKQEDELRKKRREQDDSLRKENPNAFYGKILRLEGKVTRDEVKRRYRELIKAYHPDLFQNLDSEFVELATTRTQQINEAFQYFSKKYGI